MATVVFGVAIGFGVRAQADELSRKRPPMRLELAACLEPQRDAILRAVRVEVGDAATPGDASTVAVRVECAAAGVDAGVVLEVRQPGTPPRRYQYALDWRAQPQDARPRLVGLAVAEAVDASLIELTAVAEPAPPAPDLGSPGASRAASGWTIALVGDQRAFSAHGGVDLLGGGLIVARRLSAHLRLATDVAVEGATVLTQSGAIAVRSISSAPRIVYHAGGRLHGELGIGGRLGAVRMRGEALPHSQLGGASLLRTWFGPVAIAGAGIELMPGIAVSAYFELGAIASGATARDLGEPVTTLGGVWTSFGLAATIAL